MPLLLILALLQVTLMPNLTIAHVQPDLMLAAVVCWALFRGATGGAVCGFLAGMATDLLSGGPFGMYTFVLTTMGMMAGLGAAMIPSEHAMLLPGMALLCTVLQQAAYVILLRAAGWPIDWSGVLLPVVIPSAVLNLLLTLLLYPLVGRLHRKLAQEEPGW